MSTLEANAAYRLLAKQLLTDARRVAEQGEAFGDRVPLASVVDMTDRDWHDTLVELHRMGLIELHRADLWWAWETKFGNETMQQSTLRHSVSEWHAVTVPGWLSRDTAGGPTE